MAYIGKMKDRNGNVVYPQTKLDGIIDYEPLKISDWSTTGIVLAGNFGWDENSKGYRFVQLPNGKDVEFDLKFHPVSVKGLVAENIITIPDSLRADAMGISVGFSSWQQTVFNTRLWDNKVSIYRTDGDSTDNWNGSFFIHVRYFHHD